MTIIPAVVALANASHYEKNPGRFVTLALIATASAAFVHYMSPTKHEVFARSGLYEITAPKPKDLKYKREQLDICAKYIGLFETSQDRSVDCRAQLKNFCGINPDEILTNLRPYVAED